MLLKWHERSEVLVLPPQSGVKLRNEDGKIAEFTKNIDIDPPEVLAVVTHRDEEPIVIKEDNGLSAWTIVAIIVGGLFLGGLLGLQSIRLRRARRRA